MPDAIGIDFPFRPDTTGFPKVVTDTSLVTAAAKQVLLTERGERLMRPTFGSRIRSYLFEQVDSITLEALKAEIQIALDRNLSRDILITSVTLTADPTNDTPQPGGTTVYANVQFDRQGRSGNATVLLS